MQFAVHAHVKSELDVRRPPWMEALISQGTQTFLPARPRYYLYAHMYLVFEMLLLRILGLENCVCIPRIPAATLPIGASLNLHKLVQGLACPPRKGGNAGKHELLMRFQGPQTIVVAGATNLSLLYGAQKENAPKTGLG